MAPKIFKNRLGFTLIELLITFGVLILIVGALIAFQTDFFALNKFLGESFLIQEEAQIAIRAIVKELRTASQSNTGGYALEKTDSESIAFYANIDSDGLKERVQYFLDGNQLKKSVIKPQGQPLTYSTTTAQEIVTIVLRDVLASSTQPIFSYFNSAYAGTSTPLTQPVDILAVRHVGIFITVDKDRGVAPPPVTVSSQVSIRNLKDNL